MKLEEIPDMKKNRYPERINIAISNETKRKLDLLRREKGKDVAEMIRMVINDFLKEIEV